MSLSTYAKKSTEQLVIDLSTYQRRVELIQKVLEDREIEAEQKKKKDALQLLRDAKTKKENYREVQAQMRQEREQWKHIYQFDDDVEDDGIDRKHSAPKSVSSASQSNVAPIQSNAAPAPDMMAQLTAMFQQMNARMDKFESVKAAGPENPPQQ